MSMTGSIDRVEVITSVQRRRRWSAEEKTRIVEETYAPGMSVSLVARQHGVAPNQVFKWWQLYAQRVVSHRSQRRGDVGFRIPGFAAPGARIATAVAVTLARSRGHPVKRVAETLGVARSNLIVQAAALTALRRGRHPQPEAELLAEIKAAIAGQPAYGYRRIHALIRRQRCEQGAAPVNVKWVYRVMKAHGLLLERHSGHGKDRRHDGRIAVDRSNRRWCSDGFEIG